GRLSPTGVAPRGHRIGCDIRIIGVLIHVPSRKPAVDADAQQMRIAYRRAKLDLAAQAGRGRRALVERFAEGGGGNDDVREIARLDVGERVDLPGAARDEADTGVLPLAKAIGASEAQGPGIAEQRCAELDL